MSEFRPTPAQRAAIETTGRSILVSAGAGSGKTAVLAERCAYLVTDAKPVSSIDRLLVVTFTEAAAAEMRDRIGKSLRRRADERPGDRRLKEQLALLDAASISTIHAFGKRTLDRYFAEAGIDPGSAVLDESDALLLRQETAQGVFDAFAARDDAEAEPIHALVDRYGRGRDGEADICRRVIETDAFLSSLPAPRAWVEQCVARLTPAEDGGLPPFWFELLLGRLGKELEEQGRIVRGYLREWEMSAGVPDECVSFLEAYSKKLEDWLGRLKKAPNAATVDGLCTQELVAFKFVKLPSKNSKEYKSLDAEGQGAFERATQRCRAVKEKLFERRLVQPFARFSVTDWAKGFERTRPHVETFFKLVQAFREAYQQAKIDQGVLDFNDLERKTLELLADESNGVARRLRDRYDHVLVDEFQDVSPIQAEILRRVSRDGDPARDPHPVSLPEGEGMRAGNLFTVGDVKQSIYRFRLAEPRLFLERRRAFDTICPTGTEILNTGEPLKVMGKENLCPATAPGMAIDLRENFRSGPGVIAAVNAVFERLMTEDLGGVRYDERAKLVLGRVDKERPPGPAMELHVLDAMRGGVDDGDDGDDENENGAAEWERIEREAYVIAHRIQALVAGGAAYKDIVILMRSVSTHGSLFVRTLARLGVPVFAEVPGGFFDTLEMLDVLSLLAVLDNAQQDIPSAAVLRGPLLGAPLTDAELAEIRTAPGARGLAFHAAVRRYAREGANRKLRERLAAIEARLDGWRVRCRRRPLAETLWQIYEETGYLSYVSGLSDGSLRRANLIALHERARQFDQFHRHGLHRFLRFLDELRGADADLETAPPASAAADVVRVMTIHRSKGLEFPIVFVAEAGKRFNLRDSASGMLLDRELGAGWEAVDLQRRARYPTLSHRLAAQSIRRESLAEELRVLYVALTRAEDRLIVVGSGSANWVDLIGAGAVEGPLPALERHGANSTLGWLSAAIASQRPGNVSLREMGDESLSWTDALGDSLFGVYVYPPGSMAHWAIDPVVREDVQERLDACRRLESLPEAERIGDARREDVVRGIDRRLHTPYAESALTRVPAVAAASVLKQRWDSTADPEEPIAAFVPPEVKRGRGVEAAVTPVHAVRLATPRFRGADAMDDPTIRGTITHALLERLRLDAAQDERSLCAQLETLVESGVMSREEAALVDMASIAWFFQTPLGRRLTATGVRHLREWPFVIGVDPSRYEPAAAPRDAADCMLVRGMIDCVFDAGDGWEILDYKTDAVTGAMVGQRAAEYRGQLDIYSEAIRAAFGQPAKARWLVFLAAREVVESPGRPTDANEQVTRIV